MKKSKIITIILLFILLGAYTVIRGGNATNDMRVFYYPVRDFLSGNDITAHLYFYAPVVVALFTPIGCWNMYVAAGIWYLLNVIFFMLSLGLCASLLSSGDKPDRRLWIYPVMFSLIFIVDTLMLGQINMLILLLICSALYWIKKGKPETAGIFLGFASVLKITPLLFIAYFIFKKQFRIMKGVLISLLVFIVIIPVLFFGVGKTIEYHKTWFQRSFFPQVTNNEFMEGRFYRSGNQSLEAMANRFLTDLPYNIVSGKYLTIKSVSILHFGRNTVKWITRLLVLIILCIMMILCRVPAEAHAGSSRLINFEYSLVLIAMVLISPLSWTHHFVILLFPAFVIVDYIIDKSGDVFGRKLLKTLMIISFILFIGSLEPHIKALSPITIGTLLLFTGMLIALKMEEDSVVFRKSLDI